MWSRENRVAGSMEANDGQLCNDRCRGRKRIGGRRRLFGKRVKMGFRMQEGMKKRVLLTEENELR